MAAAASVAMMNVNKQAGSRDRNRRQQDVPVHLKGILTELDDKDPVRVIEGLARQDTQGDGFKVSKLTSQGSWLPVRLITTKDRVFLLKKSADKATFDIVDSIPLHQIILLCKADIPKQFCDSKIGGSEASSRVLSRSGSRDEGVLGSRLSRSVSRDEGILGSRLSRSGSRDEGVLGSRLSRSGSHDEGMVGTGLSSSGGCDEGVLGSRLSRSKSRALGVQGARLSPSGSRDEGIQGPRLSRTGSRDLGVQGPRLSRTGSRDLGVQGTTRLSRTGSRDLGVQEARLSHSGGHNEGVRPGSRADSMVEPTQPRGSTSDEGAPMQISDFFIMKSRTSLRVPPSDLVFAKSESTPQNSTKTLLGILSPSIRKKAPNAENSSVVEVRTMNGGFNQGKIFFFDFENEYNSREWLQEFQGLVEKARVSFRRQHAVEYIQSVAKQIFDSDLFQFGIVISTVANFGLAILQASVRDENTCSVGNGGTSPEVVQPERPIKTAYDDLAIFFTLLYILELAVNFVANAWRRFWHDKWNWFDFIIITASSAVIFSSTTNNVLIKQTRILRALRVARVFGRFGNISEITVAISASVRPAAHALLVGLIVLAIYSVIGREFYGRDYPRYFCDLFHAFYTMFGVVALGTDPLPVFDTATGTIIVSNAIFMYSYIAVVVFVLLQVVVGVLLESFYKARQRGKEKAAQEAALKASLEAQAENPLDSILEELAAAFDTGENLDLRLRKLFDAFDVDGTKAITFTEFAEGLFKAKQVRPQIEDFERMTDGGRLCNASQEIEFDHFRAIMRGQLKDFVQRRLAQAQADADIQGDMQTLLSAMKLLLVNLDRVGGDAAAAAARVEEQSLAIREDVALQACEIDALRGVMHEVLCAVRGAGGCAGGGLAEGEGVAAAQAAAPAGGGGCNPDAAACKMKEAPTRPMRRTMPSPPTLSQPSSWC